MQNQHRININHQRLDKIALVLMLLILFGSTLIGLIHANPYSQAGYEGEIPAPSKPALTVSFPENNTDMNKTSISAILNVTVTPTNKAGYVEHIFRVGYKADWLEKEKYVYDSYAATPEAIKPKICDFNYCLNLSNIPEGKHNITVSAIETGFYYPSMYAYYRFSSNTSSIICFSIDTTSPVVSILSVKNTTYGAPDLTLDFKINEPASKVMYILDQENVTINGNTTLAKMLNGLHNITVLAWDAAGNLGRSETVIFTIAKPESFPTSIVLAVSFAVMAIVVAISMLLYRRHQKNQPKNLVKKIRLKIGHFKHV